MGLPIRTTLDDIREVCRYFATKPTGATVKEAKTVLDPKKLDTRKVSALRNWGLLQQSEDGRLTLSAAGRRLAKDEPGERQAFLEILQGTPAYNAIIERVAHRHEDSLDTTEVAAHWYEHFKEEVSDKEKIIKDQAVCFFHIVEGAGLGKLIAGRKGSPTRISFDADALSAYISGRPSGLTTGSGGDSEVSVHSTEEQELDNTEIDQSRENEQSEAEHEVTGQAKAMHGLQLGQSIFIAHGKNKKPAEQLKKILDQFHIPYRIAVDEPNLGRPISGKVREIMHSCNCAILIFTADEEFQDKEGNTIWRPSENVVYELGATGYLYDRRIVILKEDKVTFPSNFSDLGYISFEDGQLEAKTMDVLKELIGFGIVRVST